MMAGLLMRKTDFVMCGSNPWTLKENTHIPVTIEQARWVAKNPAVNGPKMLLFYVTSSGMPDGVRDEAFMDLLRKEQALQDKGAAGVPDELKTATVAPVAAPVAPVAPEPAKTDGPSPIEQIRDMLTAMEDKAAIIKYSVETLGQKLGLDNRWGKERMIAAICDELAKKA